jgi:periplasmic divalent cation tolerance protein
MTTRRSASPTIWWNAGLAACVSIGAPVRSVYRWQGAVEQAVEVPLAIKTTADRYDALEQALHGSPI